MENIQVGRESRASELKGWLLKQKNSAEMESHK